MLLKTLTLPVVAVLIVKSFRQTSLKSRSSLTAKTTLIFMLMTVLSCLICGVALDFLKEGFMGMAFPKWESLSQASPLVWVAGVSLAMGSTAALGNDSRSLYFFNLSEAVNLSLTTIWGWVMKGIPAAIFSFVAVAVSKEGFVGLKTMVVYGGLAALAMIAFCLCLLGMVFGILKLNFLRFFNALIPSFMSSVVSANIEVLTPVVMDLLMAHQRFSNRVVSFVLPLGARFNAQGTLIFSATAFCLLLSKYGLALSLANFLLILPLVLMVWMMTAGLSRGWILSLVILLSIFNLPLEGLGIFLVFDGLWCGIRTMTNVWATACATAFLEKSLNAT